MAVTPKMKIAASVLLIISVLITSPKSEAAMDCNFVLNSLFPCYNYMMYGGTVSYQCCAGVNNLNNAARTTTDRQTACSCLKRIAANASPGSVRLAADIPRLCRINIPYKIDPQTDCSSVR